MKKIAVVGSRDFNDYVLLCSTLDKETISMIVSGGARGADSLAEKYANEHNIPIQVYPAQWNKYGKIAGFLRNEIIVKNSEKVIAFWDGKSKGTKHTISLAKLAGIECDVILY